MLRPGLGKRLSPAASSADSVAKKPRVDLTPKVVKPPENAGKGSKVVKPPEHVGKGSKVVKPPLHAGKGSKTTPSLKGASGAKGSLSTPAAKGRFVRTPVAASGPRPTSAGVRVAAPGAKPATPGAVRVAPPGAKPAAPGARIVSAPQPASVQKAVAPAIGRFAANARARPTNIMAKLLAVKGSGKVGTSKTVIGAKPAVAGKSAGKKAPVTVLPPKKVGVKVKPPPRSVPAPAGQNVPPPSAKGKAGKKGAKGIPCKFFQTGACKNGANCPFVHSKVASVKGGSGKGASSKGASGKLVPKVVVAPRKVAPPNGAGKGVATLAAPKVVAPPQRNVSVDAQEDPVEPLEEELVQEIRGFLDENGGKADGREVLEKFPEVVKEQLREYFALIEDDSGDFLVSAVDAEDEEENDREPFEQEQEDEPWPDFDDEEEPQAEEQEEEYEMQADEEYEMQAQDAEEAEEEQAQHGEDAEEEQAQHGEDAEEEQAQNGEEAEEEYEMQEEDLGEANAEEGENDEEAELPEQGGHADEAETTESPTAAEQNVNGDKSKGTLAPRVIGAAIGSSAPSQPASKGVGKASRPKGGMLVLPPARTVPPKPQPQVQQKGAGKAPCKFFAKGACRNGTSCQFSHG